MVFSVDNDETPELAARVTQMTEGLKPYAFSETTNSNLQCKGNGIAWVR